MHVKAQAVIFAAPTRAAARSAKIGTFIVKHLSLSEVNKMSDSLLIRGLAREPRCCRWGCAGVGRVPAVLTMQRCSRLIATIPNRPVITIKTV